MNTKKILSILLAVAMALSMVVAPVAAEEEAAEYALKLAGAGGESTIIAEPGTTVDIYLSTYGAFPGFNNIGGYISYPEGWSVATTDLFTATIQEAGADGILFTNADDVNPVCVVWTCEGMKQETGNNKIMEYTGNLAKLSFTIPEDAQPGIYDLTLDTQGNKVNWVYAHDENNVITSYYTKDAQVLSIPAINCSIEVVAAAAPVECPEHGEVEWTEVAEGTWTGGALTTGHYKLMGDQTISAKSSALTIAADQTVCIDLNGFNITQTTTVETASTTSGNKYARIFENSGALNIMDSTATTVEGVYTSGVISGGWSTARAGAYYARGGNYYGDATSTLNLYSGTFSGGISRKHGIGDATMTGGGNIYSAGTVNIYGGMVKDGRTYTNYSNGGTDTNRTGTVIGGNISVVGGTFNMTGGTVTGGTATNTVVWYNTQGGFSALGGNINLADGTVATISGGVISNGAVSNTAKGADGKATTLNANAMGGNIYVCDGSELTVSGTAVISGGTAHAAPSPAPVSSSDATLQAMTTVNAYARGGNIYVVDDNSALTIAGGTILGGVVTATATNNSGSGKATASYNGGSIYAKEGTTLNITGGTIGSETEGGQAANGGNIYLAGTMTMSGGTISGGTVTGHGGNLYAAGNVTMSGGLITKGQATTVETSLGGNIRVDNITFTMSGGAITDGYSGFRGGNIQMNDGELLLSGNAVISGGTIPTDSTKYWGGNIYGTSSPVIKMEDNAVISGGTAGRGGNVFLYTGGTLYMNGGAIYGGTAVKEASGDDLVLGNNATTNPKLYMYGGYIGKVCDGGTNLFNFYNGVTSTDVSDFTTTSEFLIAPCAHTAELANGYYNIYHASGACATCGHTYKAYGISKDYQSSETEHLTLGGVHTYVEGVCACGYAQPAYTATCSHGCESVTWVPFDGATLEDGGHYYLTDNVGLAAAITISGKKVCIDLNGYTLTAAPCGRAFTVSSGADVAVMDSSEANTGLIRGFSLPTAANGGNVSATSGSVFTLYDATIANGLLTAEGSTSQRGGNMYASDATLVIDNGKVLNGSMLTTSTEAQRGGNICIYNPTANLIIKGADAKIAGGCVNGKNNNCYGGNLYSGSGGDLYIYDGEISGGFAKNGSNIYWMNGEGNARGHIYMYGGLVGAAGEGVADDCANFQIHGTNLYQNDFFMFGGQIDSLNDGGEYNDMRIYAGVLKQDPRTLNSDGTSMLGECACVTYDEVTGLYTVGHINGAATCGACSGKDMGYANGYSEAHTFTNLASHTYAENATVCSNCCSVVAMIGETEYTELTTALAAAATTDTVVLVKDAFVSGNVDIYTTLDLNGNDLKASGRVDSANTDGKIRDSVGTGTAAAEGGVYMIDTNGMLAIDAANNGIYNYEEVTIAQKLAAVKDENGNEIAGQKFVKFYIEQTAAATKLDDAIAAGSDVQIQLTVSWGEEESHTFFYEESYVNQYLANWNTKMFTCTVAGLESLGDYTITAEVKSDGVVVEAYTVTP